MEQGQRSNMVAGLLIILIGAAFLAAQIFPNSFAFINLEDNWPLLVIGVGVFLFLMGLLTSTPALAIPASIVGGIGGILYWQNVTGSWESWAYIWTLIPGFVGVGVFVSGLLAGQAREGLRDGSRTIMVSLIMFAIFGSLLGEGQFSGLLWPIILIGAGLMILLGSLFRPR
ncbi:MAG: hypothetical protein MUO58_00540 [Anaerolineales bacterium]|nr:hypothetical protein [Anaerolineales bacterium]